MTHRPHPRKFVRDFLIYHSFHDRELNETVNSAVTLTRLRKVLQRRYGVVDYRDVPEWLDNLTGHVLFDGRGRGFMQ